MDANPQILSIHYLTSKMIHAKSGKVNLPASTKDHEQYRIAKYGEITRFHQIADAKEVPSELEFQMVDTRQNCFPT